ncbi:hypothetical protein K435DRAFT_668339 [Dendrothele bispora CBS 962.96]|uniref:Amine oxidase domain-containing protein n=1 Tax=Dendrothele bispora (strain CBS 962.96) TaxID=1314807 RepID=A0A4V4HFD2_DENBC|nr:hypothetical protein K435DRAFT_668339 [Dendrothele bispora CBS 962.96]
MILQNLGIKYEILEGSEYPGGRIRTHHFHGVGQWNYFYSIPLPHLTEIQDVGAMRYPDIPIMWRVFDLFRNRLQIGNELIPYITSSPNQVLGYNAQRITQMTVDNNPNTDHFNDSDAKGGVVPLNFVQQGPSHWLNLCFDPFKQFFRTTNWNTAFNQLMEFDQYSARMFMATEFNITNPNGFHLTKPVYPTSVINWLERMDTATGLFDMAFSEMVLDHLQFDYSITSPKSENVVDWYCLRGGSQTFITEMISQIGYENIQHGKRITKITPTGCDRPLSVKYTTQLELEERSTDYDYVISTIPLSSLRYVDLDRCNLSYVQREGLRTLRYDSSCKVGIKFTTRWWENLQYPIVGGQSKTDRIIRTAVFPSYGIGQMGDAVMIASYTWSQDALRVGSFCNGQHHQDKGILINAVLEDLAYLHDVPLEDLKEQCQDWYAFDWYADPYSIGAFALFGPSQFSNVYPSFGQGAAGGRLLFAGEAISEQHAWVEGALNSAYEAVYKILHGAKLVNTLQLLQQRWGPPLDYYDGDIQHFETLMKEQEQIGAVLSSN